MTSLNGLLWLLLMLGPLIFLQRVLHREIQAVFLLLLRRADLAVALFSLLLFPGVLLHEASHYLMAKLLKVPTGRVSLIPHNMGNNRLRLGFVETGQTDILRDTLIGSAPLLAGGAFVAYAGIFRLGVLPIWDGLLQANPDAFFAAAAASYARADFWLWFYLMVAVSSTMLPSPSDRRAWLPMALLLMAMVGAALFFGAGPWMSAHLLPLLNEVFIGVAAVFAISVGVHLVALLPLWLARKGLSKLIGMQVAP